MKFHVTAPKHGWSTEIEYFPYPATPPHDIARNAAIQAAARAYDDWAHEELLASWPLELVITVEDVPHHMTIELDLNPAFYIKEE